MRAILTYNHYNTDETVYKRPIYTYDTRKRPAGCSDNDDAQHLFSTTAGEVAACTHAQHAGDERVTADSFRFDFGAGARELYQVCFARPRRLSLSLKVLYTPPYRLMIPSEWEIDQPAQGRLKTSDAVAVVSGERKSERGKGRDYKKKKMKEN